MTGDFSVFLDSIKKNPFQGVDLGNGVHKVRMTVQSKGKGKSGGMRIITYIISVYHEDNIDLTLLYLYDKNEISNVSDEFISYLINHK